MTRQPDSLPGGPEGEDPASARRPHNYEDLTGRRFGRLVVLFDTGRRLSTGHVVWACRCACGLVCNCSTANLRSGNSASCRCLQRERSRESNARRGANGGANEPPRSP